VHPSRSSLYLVPAGRLALGLNANHSWERTGVLRPRKNDSQTGWHCKCGNNEVRVQHVQGVGVLDQSEEPRSTAQKVGVGDMKKENFAAPF
jgi:hypothetical protein